MDLCANQDSINIASIDVNLCSRMLATRCVGKQFGDIMPLFWDVSGKLIDGLWLLPA